VTTFDPIASYARSNPNRIAVVDMSDDRQWTYRELDAGRSTGWRPGWLANLAPTAARAPRRWRRTAPRWRCCNTPPCVPARCSCHSTGVWPGPRSRRWRKMPSRRWSSWAMASMPPRRRRVRWRSPTCWRWAMGRKAPGRCAAAVHRGFLPAVYLGHQRPAQGRDAERGSNAFLGMRPTSSTAMT
jgi:hypothetical protein